MAEITLQIEYEMKPSSASLSVNFYMKIKIITLQGMKESKSTSLIIKNMCNIINFGFSEHCKIYMFKVTKQRYIPEDILGKWNVKNKLNLLKNTDVSFPFEKPRLLFKA